MPMTRKDYVVIADVLSPYKDLMDEFTFQDLVDDFADMFTADNPNFKYEKFTHACGLTK